MPYTVDYFNQRVRDEIEPWPVAVLVDYARLVELLIESGPDVRMRIDRRSKRYRYGTAGTLAVESQNENGGVRQDAQNYDTL